MKRGLKREVGLLFLPLLLVGGAALVRSRSGLTMRTLFEKTPLHLEFMPFHEMAVTPLDVSTGLAWKAGTSITLAGQVELPPGWTYREESEDWGQTLRIVYRHGTVWKTAPRVSKRRRIIDVMTWPTEHKEVISVNLATVPRDAQEVRIRGRFRTWLKCWGTVPGGWVAPKGMISSGKRHDFPVDSEPFDVAIKAPRQLMPPAAVSKVRPLVMQDARWFTTRFPHHSVDCFIVRVRRVDRPVWNPLDYSLGETRLFDADGHEIKLAPLGYRKKRFSETWIPAVQQELNQPRSKRNEMTAILIDPNCTPSVSWEHIKQPLRLETQISDGQCWPTQIKVPLHREVATLPAIRQFLSRS